MRNYFPRLLGNTETKKRLCTQVLKNTLSHAFIFQGEFGSGKKTLALELAAALNCENKMSENHSLPCHECERCRRIRENLFADVHFVKRDPKKMSLGVDEIHKMREDIVLSSQESEYRIYIIEEAERLTPQAQNAMLTVLEEPPLGVVIILLAKEADKILTTIKSRAQTVSMQRFSREQLLEILMKQSDGARSLSLYDKEKLDGIIMTSDGRVGMALSMLEDTRASGEIMERREFVFSLVESFKQTTPFSILYKAINELPATRIEFKEILEELLIALRDLILVKHSESAPLLYYTSQKSAKEISDGFNTKRLFSVYDAIKSALRDNDKNANIGAAKANLAAEIKLI